MEHTRARQVVRVYTDGLAATQTSRVRRTAFAWWAAHTRNMACRRGIAASRASLAEMRTAREAFWAWVGYARGDHIDIDTSAHETEASDGDAASDAHGGPARSAVSEKHSLAALSARVRALSVPEVLSSLCKPTSVRRFQAAVLLAWHSQAQRSTRQGSRGPDAARQRAPKAGPREYTRAGSMAGSRMTRSGRYADAEVSQKPDAVPTPPRSTASAGEKMAALRRDLERVRKEKDRVMGLLRALQASSAAKVGEERDRVARITERAADTLFRQRARATLSKYLWRWSAAVRAPPPGRPAGSSPGLSPRMPPRGQGGEDPRWGSPVRQAAVSGSRAELSPRGYAGRPGRLERGRGETGEFSSPPRGIFVQDAPNTPQVGRRSAVTGLCALLVARRLRGGLV